jgi:hypothetical protein
MEMGMLVLAFAVIHYCGPLPPHTQAAVDAAMAKLTEEQRWIIDRESYKHATLQYSSNWRNVDPNIREQMKKMFDDECDRSRGQLRAHFGE